ncbi:hypothetical protein CONPUDRAFT_166371 [Coniophora puteana RWD-64-598 SS2]|uniref:Uncharacterized protein n=1 Tax=Coniophora puteana (strain RWD-64-598) TaxID=741705 RepID=A0A5M3MKP4_CONPW|nr:uncharacterized protein CONPUDRAFT_166371 [Coniophora puteana RWD-64-598 SS2]EIW79636.1 hypothetical protein CONPUDRAFT_166371 [Coniophora puteana RWD-64-598 SS2]
MAQKLPPQAQRLRIIIVTVPIMGATAYVLYDRLVNEKPQRTLPPRTGPEAHGRIGDFMPEQAHHHPPPSKDV